MENIFHDISKYYAANIVGNVLIIGKIIYQDGMYRFARDDVQGPFNLVDPEADVTRMVHVIGEIHPRQAVERIFPVEVNSCLYLNENDEKLVKSRCARFTRGWAPRFTPSRSAR
jgi:hypothetical protein